MLNAANKYLTCALIALAFTACGGNKETDTPGQALLNEAQASLQAADYEHALALLDSLDSSCPSEIAVRRQGMSLRPVIIEKLTMLQLSQADSLVAVQRVRLDSLSGLMVKVSNIIEPYFAAKEGRNPDLMKSDGIEARVAPDGEFYIVTSLSSSPILHSSITVTIGGESVSTPSLPYDDETNFSVNGSESLTFSTVQSDPIGQLAMNHFGESGSVSFNGKGHKTIKLSPAQVKGIATSYDLSKALRDVKLADLRKEQLNQRLTIARDQIARLSADSIPQQ